MAMMVKLLDEVIGVVEETYNRKNTAELTRIQECRAAILIQSWLRGTQVRSYLRHLNNCATLIQKTWRGFLGRKYYRIFLKNTVFIMKLNYYNTIVIKIQKVWRGHYTRNYIFDFYCRKRYLDALAIKNACLRSELKEYAEQQEDLRRRQKAIEEKEQREYEARKTHYLVSTVAQPGIYNSPFLPYPTPMEKLLASVKPLPLLKKTDKTTGMYDPTWQRYDQPKPKELPPLSDKQQGPFREPYDIQKQRYYPFEPTLRVETDYYSLDVAREEMKGPFREPSDVQKQRYRPFEPTLRVETDYYSLDVAREEMKAQEWISRINDNSFVPFVIRRRDYEPLHYTTSKFGHPPYGTEYFREEFLDKHITTEPFKRVVPPIPIFDKFNKTYSRGEV